MNGCNLSDIRKANFPIDHDCILKVSYKRGAPTSFEFFTLKISDAESISLLVSRLSVVSSVQYWSIDKFPL